VRNFAPRLFRFAYRLTGNHQTAEDLLQETFLEAWRGIEKQTGDDRALAWLFQILRFRYAHYLRDSHRDRRTSSLNENVLAENSPEHPADPIAQPLETLAERDAMQAALNSLSPAIRETFVMVFVENRTCREVAEILKIPIGTVLSRTDSGRKALRAFLNKQRDREPPADLKPDGARPNTDAIAASMDARTQ
jgi:RNA polymerase sigma-70 factor (ECF subfamily)